LQSNCSGTHHRLHHPGQGITIHRADCKQVEAITDRERLIEVDWGTEAETHPVPVVVKAYRRSGLIEDLVSTLRGSRSMFRKPS
jgi:(p)ppGpp synthase/HD superfamily hydrolase